MGNKSAKLIEQCTSNRGNIETIKHLIKNGADVNATDDSGHTALHGAAARNEVQAVKLLIDNGADVNARNEYGNSPLNDAFRYKYYEIIKLLLQNGGDPYNKNNWSYTPFYEATLYDNIINENATDYINKLKATELLKWCKNGNLEKVRTLIKCGVEVNTKDVSDNTPFYYAFNNMVNTVTYENMFSENDNLFYYAFCNVLDDSIIEHNVKDSSSYYYRLFNDLVNEIELVKILIQNGADPNIRSNSTPLQFALSINNTKLVKLLLQNGADPNIKNYNENTPLIYVINKCVPNIEQVKLLLQNGADPNIKNFQKRTPLHYAGDIELVKLLIENGADPNIKDMLGNTPLEIFTTEGKSEIVKYIKKNTKSKR